MPAIYILGSENLTKTIEDATRCIVNRSRAPVGGPLSFGLSRRCRGEGRVAYRIMRNVYPGPGLGLEAIGRPSMNRRLRVLGLILVLFFSLAWISRAIITADLGEKSVQKVPQAAVREGLNIRIVTEQTSDMRLER